MNNRGYAIVVYLCAIVVHLLLFVVSIWFILSSKTLNQEAAIAVTVFIFGSVGVWLFGPLGRKLDISIDDLLISIFIDKSIYRILIFGCQGSGKTTFIETAFTYIDPADPKRKSTKFFEYRRFRVQLHRNELNLGQYTNVEVADYRGQKPSQVIINNSADFFGPEGSRVLNAIIFIVDLVPRITDEQGNPLDDRSLLEWLRNGNMLLDKINRRVEEHKEYINQASLELLFTSLYSQNLTRVIFVINKKDLIERLIDDGYLRTNFSDFKEYAKHLFARMIQNINEASTQLRIEDFSHNDSWIFTVSARSRDELYPLIVRLLTTRS